MEKQELHIDRIRCLSDNTDVIKRIKLNNSSVTDK